MSDDKGAIVQRFAFDAWGKRINPATGATITGATRSGISRGYTDHEQLDDLGLVHMNGRIYDPLLGRFLSADPNVDGVSDAQGYNRYSYVGNNPMSATDPSGYFKLSLKEIITIVAVVVISYFTYGAASGWAASFLVENTAMTMAQVSLGAAVAGGAAAGFASSFAGSLLNGASIGSALQSGLVGAAAGAVTSGLLSRVGALSRAGKINWFERGAMHGAIQGARSEATGGDFRHGFISGFAVGASEGEIGEWSKGSDYKGLTAAAVVGGTSSALGGGKFANGAISGAFSYLYNQLSDKSSVARGSIRVEKGAGGTDEMKAMAEQQIQKLLTTKMSDGWLSASGQALDKILAAGYDVIVYATSSEYIETGFGETEPYGSNGSMITYDPRVSVPVYLGNGKYGAPLDGLSTLAHEIAHAFANAFPNLTPTDRGSQEALGRKFQNQWRVIQSGTSESVLWTYPLYKGRPEVSIKNADEYVKENPHF